MSALIARQAPSAAERLADLAVQALVDEADLSPKPGLVDRRGSGAHSDLHLGLMHASAQSLWPAFAAMADAARSEGRVSQALRETLGQLGRDGEAEMLRVTAGVNTHRGAIWALGLLCAAAALESDATAERIAISAAALARLEDPAAPRNPDSHGARVCRRYGVLGAREQAQHGFPAVIEHGLPRHLRAASRRAGRPGAHAAGRPRRTRRRWRRQPRRASPVARVGPRHAGAKRLAGRCRRPPGRHSFPRPSGACRAGADWEQLIMETLSFEFAAGQPARGKALVGVVGSGDLEVLLEPGQAGKLAIQVVTSVNGAEQRWQQLFERMFREQTLPALNIDIHDFGATPGVVRLRLEQGLEEVGHD